MSRGHEKWMRLAMEEAELARGFTGDNPWVGCAIVSPQGELIGRGHTLGPGEDHAEIDAARDAHTRGHSVAGATLYSTLEPCSFHGRTPACAASIAERGVARVVLGMRDPNPRVDGAGTRILRDAGVEVIEGVCEADVRRQLGIWVLDRHPHEVLRRAQTVPEPERVSLLADIYGVDRARMDAFLRTHLAASRVLRFSGAVKRDPAVDAWLSGQPAQLRVIARRWFDYMRACGDDVRELMHDGCPTACVGDAGFGYVNTFTAHVNVGFFRGSTLPDPVGLLQGTGKLGRHVKLTPTSAPDPSALEALITEAYRSIRACLLR